MPDKYNPTEVHNLVTGLLDQRGYRPHGPDGWEHPNGTRVTLGYTGGQVRVRRFAPDSRRFGRVPPVVWDVTAPPTVAEVALFIGDQMDFSKAPPLTPDEAATVQKFEESVVLPESWEGQVQNRAEVGVVLEADTAEVPIRKYRGDAGADLYTSEQTVVRPGTFADIPTGIRIGLPPGFWARITGRSSTLRKRGLLVSDAVIDNGYTGPIFAGVWNLTDSPVVVQAGERVAQLILHRVVEAVYEQRDEVTSADGRGSSGFGSSGL